MIKYSSRIEVSSGEKVIEGSWSSFPTEMFLFLVIIEGETSVLTRGQHSFPFKFQLPESCLPCSFESKPCTIRYYVKVTIDIPYASPPQGMKYFTIIGPHIDCMDEQYLVMALLDYRQSLLLY